MARIARVTVPGIPHHITQRGNRRQSVFFSEADRRLYLRLLQEQGDRFGITFWAYCLMDNHVHLVAVPENEHSFARGFGEVHRRYTSIVNYREGWTGFLWQGRYSSFPLDEKYLYAAVRYVELNPVRAGIVERASDYPWSSAKAHVLKQRDPLLSENFLNDEIRDWSDYLLESEGKQLIERFDLHGRTGRPLGEESFVGRLELQTGRILRPKKVGRKSRIAQSGIK